MLYIHHMHMAGIDLNLLLVFDALVEEGSVTRAARRIGLSQPATSHALGRLRTLFSDPLLVRRGSKMFPTARALELADHVRAGLRCLERALVEPVAFDPRTSDRTFTVATTDYVAFVLLPALVERLRRDAPGVGLHMVPYPRRELVSTMAASNVDLAIGIGKSVPSSSPSLQREDLFIESYVCLVREGHPKVGKRLTRSIFTALDHLLVAPQGGASGVVDTALEALGERRRVTCLVPHFLVAPLVVARSDLIVTLAERVVRALALPLGLRVFPPPVSLPGFVVAQVWGRRTQEDAGHRWLRELVRDVALELR
jgi:DNA-binding transcriptional LysR family regulator